MKTEIKGTVIHKEVKSGTTTKGDWKKETIVVKTEGEYPKTIPIGFFNKDANAEVGDEVVVQAYVSGREWEGKYYADIDGVSVSVVSKNNQPVEYKTAEVIEDDIDGLPF